MQIGTVDGEMGILVSGMQPTRLGKDQLSVTVEIGELLRFDPAGIEIILQTERRENADCVRQHVDADTKGTKFRRRLEHPTRQPAPVQRQGQRQTADAAADDEDVFVRQFPETVKARLPDGESCATYGRQGNCRYQGLLQVV